MKNLIHYLKKTTDFYTELAAELLSILINSFIGCIINVHLIWLVNVSPYRDLTCSVKVFNSWEIIFSPMVAYAPLLKELTSPNIAVADPINSYSEIYCASLGCYISSARWFWWVCTINCSIMLTDGEVLSLLFHCI